MSGVAAVLHTLALIGFICETVKRFSSKTNSDRIQLYLSSDGLYGNTGDVEWFQPWSSIVRIRRDRARVMIRDRVSRFGFSFADAKTAKAFTEAALALRQKS